MRSIVRFLMLGLIVFVGLPGGIPPVRAYEKLEVGNYQGSIDMAIHLQSEVHMAEGGVTFDGSVSINWFGSAPLVLTIINDESGLASVASMPVDLYDNSYAAFNYKAGNCFVSVGIRAKGTFSEIGTGAINFDTQQKTGNLHLMLGDLYGHEIVYETAEGCRSMAESQLIAMEQTSQQVGQNLTIKVTRVEEGYLAGTCSMPGWEGSGSTPLGPYTHIVDACYWWALQEGEHEWENK